MAANTVGVAFLGVGRMGETHLRNLTGLERGAGRRSRRSRMAKRPNAAKRSRMRKLPLPILRRPLRIPASTRWSSLLPLRRMPDSLNSPSKQGRRFSARSRLRSIWRKPRGWSGSPRRKVLRSRLGSCGDLIPAMPRPKRGSSRANWANWKHSARSAATRIRRRLNFLQVQRRFVPGHGGARS